MTTPKALEADRSGEILAGKYRVVRVIGEGGMGKVYEAEHLVVGRRFAVKFLHRHLAESEDALARFRREARAAGALENEHIHPDCQRMIRADLLAACHKHVEEVNRLLG